MPSEGFNSLVALMESQEELDMPIPERRATIEQMSTLTPPPDDVTFDEVDAGGVQSEWVTAPGATADRTIFYIHGGAYTICSPRTHRRLTAELSRVTGYRLLAVDYRLAPEHPFPAAVEDAVAAYRWLIGTGTPPEHIGIAGDSAGGGLTIATLVALRDQDVPLPAAAVTISPWADLEMTGASMDALADADPMITRNRLKDSADAYLAGTDARTPLASPIYADLTGLPPLFIHVGGRETLLDDAHRLAEKAKADGVDVTLEVEDEMIHVWHLFVGIAPESEAGCRRVAQFLKEKLTG
ncbi:MAG TPA: alpha/beta hydrolase [Actinomycetota bacterium]|jgi:acetyl esterase/lipase|nr:alpha/beta hydrolase [Actinomycetota bacterium]